MHGDNGYGMGFGLAWDDDDFIYPGQAGIAVPAKTVYEKEDSSDPDPNPTILISQNVKERMDLYIRECPDEISGLGKVKQVGSTFMIEDIVLIEQEVTGASTDLDMEGVHKFLMGLIERGETSEDWRLWWHSHVKMGVFWSSTDKATINRLCNFFGEGVLVSVVGNHYGKYKARLDLTEPFRMAFDDLDFVTQTQANDSLKEKVKEEIKDKVRRKTYTVAYRSTGQNRGATTGVALTRHMAGGNVRSTKKIPNATPYVGFETAETPSQRHQVNAAGSYTEEE